MRTVKPMFSLSAKGVDFRTSEIAGRGVFAKRRFDPGDVVTAYAPKQKRALASAPEAALAAETKLTLLSDDGTVIIPDTTVPGGWLCNHSCSPNAALVAVESAHVRCTRPIAAGDEVTVFYGWVTTNDPERDPCACNAPNCRGFINFDVTDDDAARITVRANDDGHALVTTDDALRQRLEEYGEFLRSIGQAQVQTTIANTLARLKR